MAAILIPKSEISTKLLKTDIRAMATAATDPGPPTIQSVKPDINPTIGW